MQGELDLDIVDPEVCDGCGTVSGGVDVLLIKCTQCDSMGFEVAVTRATGELMLRCQDCETIIRTGRVSAERAH